MSLEIKNLNVSVKGKKIVQGVSLTIKPGKVHVLMGPNGAGKSTFANALLGHPKYKVAGSIKLDTKNISKISTDERARAGLFLSMQYSPEITGVALSHFLRVATDKMTGEERNPLAFYKDLQLTMKKLSIDQAFATRYLNAGFSGGEKKRAEILQLLMLRPKYVILDETDSGLDVDALKIVGNGLKKFHTAKNGLLIITHYNRLLKYITPDVVHVMINGKIVKTGGKALAKEIEKNGFKKFLKL